MNAGQNPPLVRRIDGSYERLTSTGVALGMFEGSTFDAARTAPHLAAVGASEPSPVAADLRAMIIAMLAEASACYADVLRPRLADHGVHLAAWDELSDDQRDAVSASFETEISPMLTPLSLDAAHPFPFVSNLSTSWAFRVEDPVAGESVLVRVKVPRELRQWLEIPGDAGARVFVSLADVIRGNAHRLFPGMRITNASLFRICRDAEVELDDGDGLSKRRMVEREVAQRRFEPVVRVDVQPQADAEMLAELRDGLALTADDIYEMHGLFDFTTLFQIAGLDIAALQDPPWTPLPPVGLEPAAATSSPRSARGTSCSTTPTTASRRASSGSSGRPRTTP